MHSVFAVRERARWRRPGGRSAVSSERRHGWRNPLHVLLVEDNPADADLCREFLEKVFAHVDIEHVTRLSQALDKLHAAEREHIDVVLLDLHLPDALGLEAVVDIRESAPELPVVVLTGNNDANLGRAAIREHAEDYCPKQDVTPEILGRVVVHAVERHRWRNRYRQLLEINPDGLVVLDAGNVVLYANPAARRLLGEANALQPGASFPLSATTASLAAAKEPAAVPPAELRLPNDHIVAVSWVHVDWEGAPAQLVTLRDVTPSKRAEQRLLDLVQQDQLTGLASRAHFLDFLGHSVRQSRRSESALALMFIDLDRFKSINDCLGHGVGDILLQHVARRLAESVRSSDFLGRLGGDEFGLILPAIKGPQEAAAVAEKLLASFAAPITVEGRELTVGASIGIAVFPASGLGADELLRAADTAMYRAKESGRNAYHFYSEDMQAQAMQRMRLEAALRRSWEVRDFVLHFQPLWTVSGDRLVALEALLRWPAAEFAHLGPAQFVPVVEEIGLIGELGAWVLREAVAQAAVWRQALQRPIRVAVNVSGRQLRHPGFAGTVVESLTAFGVAPDCLELEVTESVFIEDSEHAAQTLAALRKIGVRTVIDDFGTGYSSLSYLLKLPITGFKLDKRFMDGLGHGAQSEAIIENLIRMAHAIGLQVTAEGVETEMQRSFLQICGCDYVQGYLFSAPRAARDVTAALKAPPR